MQTEKQFTLKFYQNLGKLFYAIAAADKNIREAEISKLKEIVKNEWLAVDDLEDDFGTDAAYQIEVVFDWLINEEDFDIEACYNDFVTYKNNQPHLFTKKVKHLILKTANAIAASFSGMNKSELMLLAKLTIELNKKES